MLLTIYMRYLLIQKRASRPQRPSSSSSFTSPPPSPYEASVSGWEKGEVRTRYDAITDFCTWLLCAHWKFLGLLFWESFLYASKTFPILLYPEVFNCLPTQKGVIGFHILATEENGRPCEERQVWDLGIILSLIHTWQLAKPLDASFHSGRIVDWMLGVFCFSHLKLHRIFLALVFWVIKVGEYWYSIISQ